MKRWFAYIAAAVVAVLLLGLLWLTQTQSGLKAVLNLAGAMGGVTIEYRTLEGKLGAIRGQQIVVRLPDLSISAEQLQLEWDPWSLFSGRVEVQHLVLQQLDLLPLTSPQQSTNVASISALPALPVTVSLARLDSNRIAWAGQEVARDVQARIELDSSQWRVAVSNVDIGPGTVQGEASIEPASLRHQASLSVLWPAQSLTADISIEGDSQATQIQAKAREQELQLSGQMSYREGIVWQGRLQAPQFNYGDTQGRADFTASGRGTNLELAGSAEWNGYALTLDWLRVQASDEQFLMNAELTLADWPLHVSAQLQPQELVQARLTLARPNTLDYGGLQQAHIDLRGPWQALSVDLQGQGHLAQVPAQLRLDGELREGHLWQGHGLNIQVLEGQIQGQSWFDLATAKGGLNLTIEEIDPARLDPRIPSPMSANLVLELGPDLDLRIEDFRSMVQAKPIHGEGQLKWHQGELREGQFKLNAGVNHQLSAQFGEAELMVRAEIANLGVLLPGTTGGIAGDLSLSWSDMLFDGALQLSDIDAFGLQVAVGHLQANHAQGPQELELTLNDVRWRASRIDTLRARVDGVLAEHRIDLALAMGERQLHLRAQGQHIDERYEIQLDRFDLLADRELLLTNEREFRAAIRANTLVLEAACFRGLLGHWCVQGQGDDVNGNFYVTMDLSDKAWRDLLSPVVDLSAWPQVGQLQADVRAQWRQGRFEQLDVTAKAQDIIASRLGEDIALGNLALALEGDHDQLSYVVSIEPPKGEVQLQGRLRQPFDADPLFSGMLKGQLRNLEHWSPWFTELDIRSGALSLNFTFDGPLSQPGLAGSLIVDDALIGIPELGVVPALAVQVHFDALGRGKIAGSVRAGMGQADLTGEIQSLVPLRFSAHVEGQRLLVAERGDLSFEASPKVDLRWHDDKAALTGRIDIVRAHAQMAKLGELTSAAQASPDVVVIDRSDVMVKSAAARQLAMELLLVFVNPGRFEGHGLSGEISGQVLLQQQPGGPLIANGELELSGSYRAYGQTLLIERGRLNYANASLDRPNIDVFASRSVGAVKVGVRVSGQADALVSELQSDPPLSQADILSYLVLGRAADSVRTSTQDSNLLASAAVALALNRGDSLVGRVTDKLGDTNVAITDELGGLALAIGRQLSPKLYLGYTVGLLEPVEVAILRYRISQRWALESELADEARASLKYRLEKD